ncbi:tetratricopeptide repeat protein [Pseudonocardia acaciae]|uniref:tetratricopeptide repeat protein n=1 Tax=Pseudonocardia acaciae TaxID=551276 RepID=UPI00048B2EAE|nr:tetratricopeptide repeat protein [Pseudonocardia acaciae]
MAPERPAPRQGVAPPEHYTNNGPQLDALSAIFAGGPERDGPRVAIIRGAPGSGRSTLADVWIHTHRAEYPDGQFVVSLAAGGEGMEGVRVALGELLAAVGTGADEIPSGLEARANWWRDRSAGKRLVLKIDDALAPTQVRALLPGAGPSAVLVIEAGQLTGLRATAAARTVDIDPLSPEHAERLLANMVTRERVDEEPEAVAALVERCGGTAIALCVVGAILADDEELTITRLAAALADDERALAELSRHRDLSLSVVFDAAYQRLSPLARACYRALGAHPGTGDVAVCTLAAVLGEMVEDVTHACRSLRRSRLAVQTRDDRYLMSGLIGQHARVVAAREGGVSTRAFVAYYRARAMEAAMAWMPDRRWPTEFWPELAAPPTVLDPATARRWMEAERVNLGAAAAAAFELGEHVWVCQLAIALWPLHDQGKFAHDMEAVNELGVRSARALAEPRFASVLGVQQGYAYRQLDLLDRAAELFTTARRVADESGSPTVIASAVEALGLARRDQGRRDEAIELLERNLALAERIGIERRIALARFHLGSVVSPEDRALALLDRARGTFAALGPGDAYTLTKIDRWRGRRLLDTGRLDEAAAALDEAAPAADRGHWHDLRADIYVVKADLALRRGEREPARTNLQNALDIYRLHRFTAKADATERRIAEL